jgi:hypothetical protein
MDDERPATATAVVLSFLPPSSSTWASSEPSVYVDTATAAGAAAADTYASTCGLVVCYSCSDEWEFGFGGRRRRRRRGPESGRR